MERMHVNLLPPQSVHGHSLHVSHMEEYEGLVSSSVWLSFCWTWTTQRPNKYVAKNRHTPLTPIIHLCQAKVYCLI